MKRTLIAIFTFFMLFPTIFSQSLRITNPNAKSQWTKGKTYIIAWNIKGELDDRVRISLYQGRNWILSIASKTKNDGKHPWAIPYSKNLKPGKYTIRLKTRKGKVSTGSWEFLILDPVPKGPVQRTILKIGSPRKGDVLTAGYKVRIKWGYAGMPDSTPIRILLTNEHGKFVREIEKSIPVSTDYYWNIRASTPAGKYRITIVVLNRKIFTKTGLFTIKPKGIGSLQKKKKKGSGIIKPGSQPLPPGIPQIIVKFPKKGLVCKYNDRLTIDWTFKVFAKSSKVKIYLRQAKGKKTYTIKKEYAITGPQVQYRLTAKIPTGDYYALVEYIPSSKYEEFRRMKPLGKGGPFTLEKGDLREIDPDQAQAPRLDKGDAQPTIEGSKVILHFSAKPTSVNPKAAAKLYYKYQHAQSAYITNGSENRTIKQLGNKSENEGYIKVWPNQTTKYRLFVNTKAGAVSEVVVVKMTSALKILKFEPKKFYPIPGEAMHLIYEFEGADHAQFTDLGTGEKRNINIGGQFHMKGKYNFTFRHPVKYRLTISRNNGKEVKTADTWISVKNTSQWYEGIHKFEIIPNSRLGETHIDIIIEVMGAKSISVFQYRKNEVVKKLRRFHVDLKEYKLYKYAMRRHHRVLSKDFAVNNYYWYEVVYWNGKKESKTFSWK